jgi:hypothetical protein
MRPSTPVNRRPLPANADMRLADIKIPQLDLRALPDIPEVAEDSVTAR